MNEQIKMYDLNQVGEITSLSKSSLYRLIKNGDLKHVKVGKAVRITSNQLQEFLDLVLNDGIKKL